MERDTEAGTIEGAAPAEAAPPPDSFAALMERWPSQAALAADVGETPNLIRSWKFRNSIPPTHWRLLVEAAERRGIAGITLEHLAGLAERRVQRGVAS
jgi:hypothetical protein